MMLILWISFVHCIVGHVYINSHSKSTHWNWDKAIALLLHCVTIGTCYIQLVCAQHVFYPHMSTAVYCVLPLLTPLSLKDFSHPETSSSLCQHPGMVPRAPHCACDPAGTIDSRDPDKCWHLLLVQQGVVCVCVWWGEGEGGQIWQICNRQHLVCCF